MGDYDLNKSMMAWLGQVTTGHGFMILAPTVLSVLTGAMAWHTALPLVVGGVIGLAWPENTSLQANSQALAADLTGMVKDFMNRPRV